MLQNTLKIKIKTKLTVGVGLLFGMIVLLALLGALFINKLSAESERILVANYHSLEYSRNMLNALDQNDLNTFERNLSKQNSNITEVGEGKLTQKLFLLLAVLKTDSNSKVAVVNQIRATIYNIMTLNMQAIERKNEMANQTAKNATLWITITGTVCFLIAFTLLVNLPSSIANPINELTTSIKQIAAKNYSQRVYFEDSSEFYELSAAFNSMAAKLEEYQNSNLAKLILEKRRTESIINNLSEPVLGFDDTYKIIFANFSALRILGITSENLVGKNATEVALSNDLLRTLIVDLVNGTFQQAKEPLKIYANNKESYFEKEIVPLNATSAGEQQAKNLGHLIILKNVTPFKELDAAKTNFISTVSHELKTPISSIKMSLQLLGKEQVGSVNEEQKHLLESIDDDANRLLKITGELLNMTQVESGSIQISIQPSNPLEIMQYAINANHIAAEQKRIKFNLQTTENLPQVLADSEKTAWVLTNFVSNAIRYSYENSEVILKIATKENFVSFSVTDTGQGIAPQYIHKIFDRYFRVPGTQKEGTGLGLSISKEFIEAQNGSISVESDFGAGSTFSILLPVS